MNYTTTISVFKSIGPSVHTRESSKILMKLIEQNQNDSIQLDFSQVEYISRSFADQFYADKMNCAIKLEKNIILMQMIR